MKYVIPEMYATTEQKLAYCTRVAEAMRLVHNQLGAWYREGTIDVDVWDALPEELKLYAPREGTITPELMSMIPEELKAFAPKNGVLPYPWLDTILRINFHRNRMNDLSLTMNLLYQMWIEEDVAPLKLDEEAESSHISGFTASWKDDKDIMVDLNTTFIQEVI